MLGVWLRVGTGFGSWLFTYDQARDAFNVHEILTGHLKIVGPPTDLGGVFHGPLYYYYLAPWYLLGSGYPEWAMVAIIFANLVSVVPLYFLSKEIFQKRLWAWVSILLYIVSFESVNYGRWLSNPTLVIPAFASYILGLWQLVNKKSSGWLWVAVGLGVAIQSQLFMLYLLPITLIFTAFYRPPIKTRQFLVALVIFGLFMSTFLVSELKFNWQGVRGLMTYFFHG